MMMIICDCNHTSTSPIEQPPSQRATLKTSVTGCQSDTSKCSMDSHEPLHKLPTSEVVFRMHPGGPQQSQRAHTANAERLSGTSTCSVALLANSDGTHASRSSSLLTCTAALKPRVCSVRLAGGTNRSLASPMHGCWVESGMPWRPRQSSRSFPPVAGRLGQVAELDQRGVVVRDGVAAAVVPAPARLVGPDVQYLAAPPTPASSLGHVIRHKAANCMMLGQI